MTKQLLILACSQAKRSINRLPALELYDGPYYKVLRKYLRTYQWPSNTSISVLSAQHGLFGAVKEIDVYDRRMDPDRAAFHERRSTAILRQWAKNHDSIHLALGQDYMPAVQSGIDALGIDIEVQRFDGGIGQKQRQVKHFLRDRTSIPRRRVDPPGSLGHLQYFVPDWDDLLDPNFNFDEDTFSGPTRTARGDQHCHRLIQPTPMCDGILVSLAQRQTSLGPLRKLSGTEPGALAPTPLRKIFGLADGQYLFGDCGAFSYVQEDSPAISTEQAIALYELYNFDLGASVDHIPLKTLPEDEQQARVRTTCDNAETFLDQWRDRGKLFTPVGSVQGTSPQQYADNVQSYYDMGYRHLAIGGLVPQSDNAIAEIVDKIAKTASAMGKERPWLHMYGIFRPKLQSKFRECGIDSFDSASYFRKAWLRSDRNYLDVNGQWYAAIRVPMTSDPRTRKRLLNSGADLETLALQEQHVLSLLRQYGRGETPVNPVLDAVLDYDTKLQRSSDTKSMKERYRRTLEDRPWQDCACRFCKQLGIQILIFRGSNRNKRRGTHNTALLYQMVKS